MRSQSILFFATLSKLVGNHWIAKRSSEMANDTVFFQQMRSYFICFAIFGLWTQWENSRYKFWLKCFSVFSVATVVGSYFSAYIFNQFFVQTSFSATVATSLFAFILIGHLIVAFETIFKSSAQFKLLSKFLFVDRMFVAKLQMCLPYRREKHELLMRSILFAVIAFVIFGSIVVYTVYRGRILNLVFSVLYSKWILQLRTIQVLFFIYLVRDRMIIVNKEIIQIQKEFTNRTAPTDRMQTISITECTTFHRILNLKTVYGELYDICESINDVFGWSLLAIVTQSFIDLTCNCYWIFHNIVYRPNEAGSIIICFGFMIPSIITLSALTFYGSSYFHCVRHMFKINKFDLELMACFVLVSRRWRQSPSDSMRYEKWPSNRSHSRIRHACSSSTVFHVS